MRLTVRGISDAIARHQRAPWDQRLFYNASFLSDPVGFAKRFRQ